VRAKLGAFITSVVVSLHGTILPTLGGFDVG
jgi:hypothetical protein